MNLADMMHKARVQMNEWSLLSAEQDEIVALSAKITQWNRPTNPNVNKGK